MTLRAVLIGSSGQLGSDIVAAWPSSPMASAEFELIQLAHSGRHGVDVTDRAGVHAVLAEIRPQVVLNTAAFVRVDDCEVQSEQAFAVNALGPKHLAEACRSQGCLLVHISTDYVFRGDAASPYCEDDPTIPINIYGVSKLAGELAVRSVLPENHIIVRSSGLYGAAGASGKGGNFVEAILRKARAGEALRVVDDQITTPTFTHDLARALLEVINTGGRGTFHLTNGASCSWYDFAETILFLCHLTPPLSPVASEVYGLRAHRPPYSVLANSRCGDLGMRQPRAWPEALAAYLHLKGHLP